MKIDDIVRDVHAAYVTVCRTHGVDTWEIIGALQLAVQRDRQRAILEWMGEREVTAKDLAQRLSISAPGAIELFRAMARQGLIICIEERRPHRFKASGRPVEQAGSAARANRYAATTLERCW